MLAKRSGSNATKVCFLGSRTVQGKRPAKWSVPGSHFGTYILNKFPFLPAPGEVWGDFLGQAQKWYTSLQLTLY